MHGLPSRGVAGEGGTIQIHIHLVEEAEKLPARQPRHQAQVRGWVEPGVAKDAGQPPVLTETREIKVRWMR